MERLWAERKETSMTPDVGGEAPDFELCDSTEVAHSLASLVTSRPRVLLFYRGHW
jgi:peroxiredoxin